MRESTTRKKFREEVFNRDSHTCVVPWCNKDAVDAHHVIERSEWENGGYFPKNGASVCEFHHRAAENNYIPPQAFWRWCGSNGFYDRYDKMMKYDESNHSIKNNEYVMMENNSDKDHSTYSGFKGKTPNGLPRDINKWGDKFTVPHWQQDEDLKDKVDYIKYPKTYHLPFSKEIFDEGRQELDTVDCFVGKPNVVTIKLDGGNALLTSDRVAARSGSQTYKDTFKYLKSEYEKKNLSYKIPDNIQIFGENMYAKHSIHYGCEGCCPKEDQAPSLESVFYVFGVFDTDYNIWLSWDEVEKWAEFIGFPTAPVVEKNVTFERPDQVYELNSVGRELVENGHEGFIIRSMYPFHYGQFQENVGKYVRKNHIKTDEHWNHTETVENVIND